MEQEAVKLNTLKYIISQNNMTQRKVSLATGIPEGRLSHVVTGRLCIKEEEKNLLCELFKMSEEELFKELYVE